ncbi:MAG: chorismate mutase [Actinomycetota bacterium]|nr:chorismate mutase [Actinomycetota bacterium]
MHATDDAHDGKGNTVAVRAVRGATTVGADEREIVLAATRELVREVLTANDLRPDDLISVLFTATPDITSVAPALAARQLGLNEVALICLPEMPVTGFRPLVVRLLAHLETDKPRSELVNVYLHGTDTLRDGVPPIPEGS